MTDPNDEGSGASSSRGGGGGRCSTVFRPLLVSCDDPGRTRRRSSEREAADAEARLERETVAAEQRCLMAEFFELNLQLANGRERQWGVARGEP